DAECRLVLLEQDSGFSKRFGARCVFDRDHRLQLKAGLQWDASWGPLAQTEGIHEVAVADCDGAIECAAAVDDELLLLLLRQDAAQMGPLWRGEGAEEKSEGGRARRAPVRCVHTDVHPAHPRG